MHISDYVLSNIPRSIDYLFLAHFVESDPTSNK